MQRIELGPLACLPPRQPLLQRTCKDKNPVLQARQTTKHETAMATTARSGWCKHQRPQPADSHAKTPKLCNRQWGRPETSSWCADASYRQHDTPGVPATGHHTDMRRGFALKSAWFDPCGTPSPRGNTACAGCSRSLSKLHAKSPPLGVKHALALSVPAGTKQHCSQPTSPSPQHKARVLGTEPVAQCTAGLIHPCKAPTHEARRPSGWQNLTPTTIT